MSWKYSKGVYLDEVPHFATPAISEKPRCEPTLKKWR